uniref:Cupin type-2 domain-containing protein n=1 Tax=Paramoeba aestuarina TaxID=180227 RepID=A0A7S4P5X3_9EUKA|mmetsp:Transcript_36800/g.57822  ORF Transcript_36800/g.57822 Transcript_36800/m.57822 type:complete len:196 (+) Transcript_36800:53-640(+)
MKEIDQLERETLYFETDGFFPNNSRFPVIKYRGVLFEMEGKVLEKEKVAGGEEVVSEDQKKELMRFCESFLVKNGWIFPWEGIVYTYHHYHSNAWEGLCCVQGTATVQLGGEKGVIVDVECGDVLLIPPGVAHKGITQTPGFSVLGTYPEEAPEADLLTKPPTPQQREFMETILLPSQHPISGRSASWEFLKETR